jgi:hypothetical protein
MNLSNQDVQLAQAMFVSSATQQHPLGTRGCTPDGRVYRYVLNGAVDTIAGKIYQSPAVPTVGHQQLTMNTTSNLTNAQSITVTCISSVGANFYSDGYAMIASSAGQGFLYTIQQHPAVTAGGTGVFTFYPDDLIQTALTVTSIVTLVPNKYKGIVIVPATTATGIIVGVAPYVITLAQYGWVQTWGQCAVGQLMNGIAASCGRAAGISSPAVTACYIVGQIIGQIYQTGVAGEWVCIDLRISP